MDIRQWQQVVHGNAKSKGWWEGGECNIPEKLALIHSEVSEALEDYRDGNLGIVVQPDGKPTGFPIELADNIIRTLDLAEKMGLDMERAMQLKHDYNQLRAYRHGGKAC